MLPDGLAGASIFEGNPELALRWATRRAAKTGKPAAILRAEIDLAACLDLTQPTYQVIARNAHRALEALWQQDASITRPEQMSFEIHDGQVRAGYHGDWENYGRNDLDFQVVENAIKIAKDKENLTLDTVRGVFLEDAPLYPSSWFFEGAHVAIAVREPYARIHNQKCLSF
jgi:hypothetical protein